MKRMLQGLAMLVAIVSVVWIAVLWRWQATSRDMTSGDILVYLGVLPLVLFGAALFGRAAWANAGKREAERAERQAANASATVAAAPAAAGDEKERHATVQLLAAPLITPAGDSASAVLSAAKEGEPRPSLDEELQDEDGLPVLTARIVGLDVATLTTESEPMLEQARAQNDDWSGAEPGEHVMRALAALHAPLEAAIDALEPWAPALVNPPPAIDPSTGRVQAAPPQRSVRVLLGWPTDWSEFEQAFARTVTAAWLTVRAATALPGTRVITNAQPASGEELLLQADHLLQMLARSQQDEPLIVATCHSAISFEAVNALSLANLLYDARARPKGQMPGEGAIALVLASSQWPAAPDASEPVPHLHRPSSMRRDKSIDAPGRVSSQVAVATLTSALGAARLEVAAIGGAVSAADQHTERTPEFFTAAHTLLPELDPTEDLCSTGHVTGAIGGVSALLVVACAAEMALATEKPVLAMSMADPFARLALVALPSAPLPAGAPAGASAGAPAA